MRIVDLRKVSPRQLEPLLDEEQRFWLDELLWDYRPSAQLIRKFVEGRSLSGCAALEGETAVGYGFYVVEETKGLIGGLYVSVTLPPVPCGAKLIEGLTQALGADERVKRIETQLMSLGHTLDEQLVSQGYSIHPRNFMLLTLKGFAAGGAPVPQGLRLERWDDRYFEQTARLIQECYAGHVDADINDQYRSEAGALKFLKNIVILPGCGEFQPYASFVVRRENSAASSPLVAVVLASTVSLGVGHITQICVLPEFRGHGLGLRLMEASIQALISRRYHALSLTVTAANETAVRLYEHMGFRRLRTFTAAVRQE
jgi:ribosomal protein S18 acetylase RimI-like enzyme